MPAVKVDAPSLRQQKAQLTRSRIAQAARALFAERGYGATTLEAVAAEAGVAIQTVYAVYGSKAAILRTLRDALLHDEDAAKVYAQALDEREPETKLDLMARSIRIRWEHGSDIIAMNEMAATSDAELRREVETILSTRRAGLTRLARTLEKHLVRGLGVERAAAILDALTLHSLFATLVVTHGWRPEEYEAWLAAALKRALLR